MSSPNSNTEPAGPLLPHDTTTTSCDGKVQETHSNQSTQNNSTPQTKQATPNTPITANAPNADITQSNELSPNAHNQSPHDADMWFSHSNVAPEFRRRNSS